MDGDALSSLALASLGLYGFVTLLGRTALQRLRERDSGWRGISGRPGSLQWWAGVLLVVAVLALPLAVILPPAEPLVPRWRLLSGGVGFLLGFGFTLHAQLAMGRSWRIGVREGERTALRTDGPFRLCRNPVFTGMLASIAALVLWVPWLAAPWLLMLLALELQVRWVEEPHLRATHGEAYRTYAARTGRFVPGLGRGCDPLH